jgi:hypothetical protein
MPSNAKAGRHPARLRHSENHVTEDRSSALLSTMLQRLERSPNSAIIPHDEWMVTKQAIKIIARLNKVFRVEVDNPVIILPTRAGNDNPSTFRFFDSSKPRRQQPECLVNRQHVNMSS